jgi:hypothetical protein
MREQAAMGLPNSCEADNNHVCMLPLFRYGTCEAHANRGWCLHCTEAFASSKQVLSLCAQQAHKASDCLSSTNSVPGDNICCSSLSSKGAHLIVFSVSTIVFALPFAPLLIPHVVSWLTLLVSIASSLPPLYLQLSPQCLLLTLHCMGQQYGWKTSRSSASQANSLASRKHWQRKYTLVAGTAPAPLPHRQLLISPPSDNDWQLNATGKQHWAAVCKATAACVSRHRCSR